MSDTASAIAALIEEELDGDCPEGVRVVAEATRLLFWGLLFLLWTVWAWWAALAAAAIVAVAYRSMVQAAGAYGDLLRAAFDVHRFALYDTLRLPAVKSSKSGICQT